MSHMRKKHRKIDEPRTESRLGELREAIVDADTTGLIAGEELITEAETVLPASGPPDQHRPKVERRNRG